MIRGFFIMLLNKMKKRFKDYAEVEYVFWHSHIDALQLKENDEVLIFGCGMWGKALYKELNNHKNVIIRGFCDNNKTLQGAKIEEIFVYSPDEGMKKYPNAVYIIAINKYSDNVRKQLLELGIEKNCIRILNTKDPKKATREYFEERLNEKYFLDKNSIFEPLIPVVKNRLTEDNRDFRVYIDDKLAETLDNGMDPFAEDVMDQFEKFYGKYNNIECISTAEKGKTKAKVMIACCHKDRGDVSEDSEMYYTPIQVGRELTDICLYDLCDNTGIHISERNYNYCECTALYWAWKNQYASDADYIGLRHYRRKFDITDEQLCHLSENEIDIVHVDPTYHENIKSSFINFTKNEKDWDLMKAIIETHFPEYYPTMIAYEGQHFICAYNMTIMRRNIFDIYCQFLFGVLLEIEAFYLKRCDRRDRYLGYLAENLTSIFLMHNKDKYKMVIAKLIPLVEL